jgi:uncharacterized protein (TIGR00251 family)
MLFNVKVIPRASRNEVITVASDALRVRLTAAPVDGKANDALVDLLSDHFDVAKSKIKIVRGGTSKNKVVEIPI